MIRIFHNEKFMEWGFRTPGAEEVLRRYSSLQEMEFIAVVRTDDLDEAYRLTNNIDKSWTLNPEIIWSAEPGHFRSTSVGDLMIRGKDVFLVDNVGFRNILEEIKMKDVDDYISKNGIDQTLSWVKTIANVTGNESGMFGVMFPELIPYLEAKKGGK